MIVDLVGKKFGRLTVIRKVGKTKGRKVQWECVCECGETKVVTTDKLNSGHTQSCGCLRHEATTKHGMWKDRLYTIWLDMKGRCGHHRCYKTISVCSEWSRSFEVFRDWSLTNGYSDSLSIDRINNEDGYCPENCRWVDWKVQSRNKRTALRIPDGTPLMDYMDSIGLRTHDDNGHHSKDYERLRYRLRKGREIV